MLFLPVCVGGCQCCICYVRILKHDSFVLLGLFLLGALACVHSGWRMLHVYPLMCVCVCVCV